MGLPQQSHPFAGNHAVTNMSYEQNANRIPGLAFGVSPPVPTPSYRPEIQPSWPQAPSTAPPKPASSQAQPAPSFQPQTNGRSLEHPLRGQTGPVKPSSLPLPVDNPLEEGELSEGEFEDLYEPKETGATAQTQHKSPPHPAFGFSENHASGASDADGSSLYNIGSPREEPVVEGTSTSMPLADDEYSPEEIRQPAMPQRERSGSYSPCLSPSELQRKASVTQATVKDSKSVHSVAQPNSIAPRIPEQAARGADKAHFGSVSKNKVSTVTSVGGLSNGSASFHSVSEAKKKAQEAILGLWPLKVRYQNYIDEGFDENLMKTLFAELGLDVSMPKSSIPTTKNLNETRTAEETSPKSTQPSKPSQPKSDLNNNQTPTDANVNDANMVDKPAKSAAEERKDKIARKLAAKAQKTTTVGPTPSGKPPAPASSLPSALPVPAVAADPTNTAVTLKSPAVTNSPTPAGSLPAKAKTRAENNALLHQKLAALKKKEQEKAAAAAAAQATTQKHPIIPVQASTSTPAIPLTVRTNVTMAASTDQPQQTSSVGSQPTSKTADSSRRSVSTQPQSRSQPQSQPQLPPKPSSASKEDVISGLSLPTAQSTHSKPRPPKRPVASDFDNFSTHSSTLKRARTQESLIIDVSDDEDVEMDIGSPTDGPATSIRTANPPGGQTPLAAHPPLSNPPAWKPSSPSSSAAQVPEKSGKLGLLHGRIEEMKRKIAEAEAKKKSTNPTSASQTPSNQSSPALEPARLPKASDFKGHVRKAGFERRNRIASVDLPAVEATLKEKRDRLKELVSQATQLELDLQAVEAEKQRLANEMQQLGDTAEGDSTETSARSSALVSSGTCSILNVSCCHVGLLIFQ